MLHGGVANRGLVVRVGPHVLRPSNPHSRSIFAFLRDVRTAGFGGVPLPVGIDADGRERLEFIEGDAPAAPYPAWALADGAWPRWRSSWPASTGRRRRSTRTGRG